MFIVFELYLFLLWKHSLHHKIQSVVVAFDMIFFFFLHALQIDSRFVLSFYWETFQCLLSEICCEVRGAKTEYPQAVQRPKDRCKYCCESWKKKTQNIPSHDEDVNNAGVFRCIRLTLRPIRDDLPLRDEAFSSWPRPLHVNGVEHGIMDMQMYDSPRAKRFVLHEGLQTTDSVLPILFCLQGHEVHCHAAKSNLWVGNKCQNPSLVFFCFFNYYYSSAHLTLLHWRHIYLWKTESQWKSPSLCCLFSTHGWCICPAAQTGSVLCTHWHTQTLSSYSVEGSWVGLHTALQNKLAIFYADIH